MFSCTCYVCEFTTCKMPLRSCALCIADMFHFSAISVLASSVMDWCMPAGQSIVRTVAFR